MLWSVSVIKRLATVLRILNGADGDGRRTIQYSSFVSRSERGPSHLSFSRRQTRTWDSRGAVCLSEVSGPFWFEWELELGVLQNVYTYPPLISVMRKYVGACRRLVCLGEKEEGALRRKRGAWRKKPSGPTESLIDLTTICRALSSLRSRLSCSIILKVLHTGVW